MPFLSVIVRDVDELDKYRARLLEKKQELEDLLEDLSADCRDQGRNWEDGQYREFQKQLETYTSGAARQLDDLQQAIGMVTAVLNRLK